MDSLFFIKALIVISAVLILAYIAEKFSPRLAGFISGFPTGSALSMIFFAIENGNDFAASASIYNMAGLFAMQVVVVTYYFAATRFHKKSIIWAPILSFLAYLVAASLTQNIQFSIISAIIIPAITIPIFLAIAKKIPESRIEKRIKLTPKVLILRSLVAASVIIFVTSIAKAVGPKWAGLFSAFPTTVFPLLIIVHHTYGKEHAATIVKHFPQGLASMIFFNLGVFYAFPLYGPFLGLLIAYLFTAVYIGGYFWVTRITRKTKD